MGTRQSKSGDDRVSEINHQRNQNEHFKRQMLKLNLFNEEDWRVSLQNMHDLWILRYTSRRIDEKAQNKPKKK
jgi:hypothetical protein